MGLVIEVSYCHDWNRVYFVQNMDETEAKEKAYKMFKQTMSCYLPETLEKAIEDNRFSIDVLAEVEQIIL